MAYKQNNYRYPENWQAISRQAKIICPVCCYCLKSPSEETHHTRYSDDKGLLLDRAEIGIDLIPLCLRCHKIMHNPNNYVIVKSNDSLNHNTEDIIFRLKFGFQINSKRT